MWVDDVLRFWFHELTPQQWFSKDEQLDREVRERFGALHEALATHALAVPDSARAMLAAVLVLDQFSRHIHRDTEQAFAFDPHALQLARQAIERNYDRDLAVNERKFLYMPFMHSEDLETQSRCVELFSALGDAESLRFAVEHHDIVHRFGRFPHRNAILGRDSTAEEQRFLEHHAGF
jgi:uncharacterized protein (DUF924 family)